MNCARQPAKIKWEYSVKYRNHFTESGTRKAREFSQFFCPFNFSKRVFDMNFESMLNSFEVDYFVSLYFHSCNWIVSLYKFSSCISCFIVHIVFFRIIPSIPPWISIEKKNANHFALIEISCLKSLNRIVIFKILIHLINIKLHLLAAV